MGKAMRGKGKSLQRLQVRATVYSTTVWRDVRERFPSFRRAAAAGVMKASAAVVQVGFSSTRWVVGRSRSKYGWLVLALAGGLCLTWLSYWGMNTIADDMTYKDYFPARAPAPDHDAPNALKPTTFWPVAQQNENPLGIRVTYDYPRADGAGYLLFAQPVQLEPGTQGEPSELPASGATNGDGTAAESEASETSSDSGGTAENASASGVDSPEPSVDRLALVARYYVFRPRLPEVNIEGQQNEDDDAEGNHPFVYKCILCVEVAFHTCPQGNRRAVTCNVGYFDRAKNKWLRIDWNEPKKLANSRRFYSLEHVGLTIPWLGRTGREIQRDTSPSAVISWLERYWSRITPSLHADYAEEEQLKITETEMRFAVVSELERLLTEDWGQLGSTSGLQFVRIVNGPIQFATVLFFWSGMVLLLCSTWVCWRVEAVSARRVEEALKWRTGILRLSETVSVEQTRLARTWRHKSAVLSLWNTLIGAVRDGGTQDSLPALISTAVETEVSHQDIRRFGWRFFVASLPGLGFLGTVWGIGSALMQTGDVLSNELAKQQSGVSNIALSLGTAFDTTLVALFLAIVAAFSTALVMAYQEGVLYRTKDTMLTHLGPLIRCLSVAGAPHSADRRVADRGSDHDLAIGTMAGAAPNAGAPTSDATRIADTEALAGWSPPSPHAYRDIRRVLVKDSPFDRYVFPVVVIACLIVLGGILWGRSPAGEGPVRAPAASSHTVTHAGGP